MDNNKLKKLRSIGYQIKRTCRSCEHALISNKDCWGMCTHHKYDHLKHSDNVRWISIHEMGWCSSYKEKEYTNYAAFAEFVVKDEE